MLIANEALWQGSVDEASVHVREVLARAAGVRILSAFQLFTNAILPFPLSMAEFFSLLGSALLKVGFVALVANEVRGFVLAGPVIYGMYAAGGTGMALWLGFCSLAGIALSVAAPIWLGRRLNLIPARIRR
jgi:hypothetical protein